LNVLDEIWNLPYLLFHHYCVKLSSVDLNFFYEIFWEHTFKYNWVGCKLHE